MTQRPGNEGVATHSPDVSLKHVSTWHQGGLTALPQTKAILMQLAGMGQQVCRAVNKVLVVQQYGFQKLHLQDKDTPTINKYLSLSPSLPQTCSARLWAIH